MQKHVTRRHFLATASAVSAAAMASSSPATAIADEAETKPKICVFTKPFNSLSFNELADGIAEAGFDGIEAPVRAGGHIEPEKVADQLPALHEALQQRGLEISILTSDINDPDDPLTEKVLRAAATLGVRDYRMKYLKYDMSEGIADQIREWKPRLKELAAMNHDFGIRGLYQNHAGNAYFGAPLWDLHLALDDIPTGDLAVAYDIRHAIAESGSAWPITLNLIRPKIAAMYIKDFRWEGDRVVNVPLGEGRVDAGAIQSLHLSDFAGPISLHEEYLDHRRPDLVAQHFAAMKRDLATLKSWIAKG